MQFQKHPSDANTHVRNIISIKLNYKSDVSNSCLIQQWFLEYWTNYYLLINYTVFLPLNFWYNIEFHKLV